MAIDIRPTTPADRDWIRQFIISEWGADHVVVHGQNYHPSELDGLVAEQNGVPVGLLTYVIEHDALEIVTLNAMNMNMGIGTALVERAIDIARTYNCVKVWLITTNDNLRALRFYQRRGFRIVAVYPGAVDRARRIKPEIPEVGLHGIPLRDEIELEFVL